MYRNTPIPSLLLAATHLAIAGCGGLSAPGAASKSTSEEDNIYLPASLCTEDGATKTIRGKEHFCTGGHWLPGDLPMKLRLHSLSMADTFITDAYEISLELKWKNTKGKARLEDLLKAIPISVATAKSNRVVTTTNYWGLRGQDASPTNVVGRETPAELEDVDWDNDRLAADYKKLPDGTEVPSLVDSIYVEVPWKDQEEVVVPLHAIMRGSLSLNKGDRSIQIGRRLASPKIVSGDVPGVFGYSGQYLGVRFQQPRIVGWAKDGQTHYDGGIDIVQMQARLQPPIHTRYHTPIANSSNHYLEFSMFDEKQTNFGLQNLRNQHIVNQVRPAPSVARTIEDWEWGDPDLSPYFGILNRTNTSQVDPLRRDDLKIRFRSELDPLTKEVLLYFGIEPQGIFISASYNATNPSDASVRAAETKNASYLEENTYYPDGTFQPAHVGKMSVDSLPKTMKAWLTTEMLKYLECKNEAAPEVTHDYDHDRHEIGCEWKTGNNFSFYQGSDTNAFREDAEELANTILKTLVDQGVFPEFFRASLD